MRPRINYSMAHVCIVFPVWCFWNIYSLNIIHSLLVHPEHSKLTVLHDWNYIGVTVPCFDVLSDIVLAMQCEQSTIQSPYSRIGMLIGQCGLDYREVWSMLEFANADVFFWLL